jgi:hypothetical protein
LPSSESKEKAIPHAVFEQYPIERLVDVIGGQPTPRRRRLDGGSLVFLDRVTPEEEVPPHDESTPPPRDPVVVDWNERSSHPSAANR